MSLLGILILLTLVSSHPVAAGGCAPSSQSGIISVNTTWCVSNSPYLVTGDVTINSGVTLTIEAGTTVQVAGPSDEIYVNGTMMAQGTMANPILFTTDNASPAPGQWPTIFFNPSSTGNMLSYVTVEYAGYFAPAMEIKSDSVTITNSTFRRNSNVGLRITDASPTISNTVFEDNGEAAIALYGDSFPILSGLSATSNDLNGIDVFSEVIEQDYTWGDGGLDHYRIRNDVTVNADSTLTIVPGTRVGFTGIGFIAVNGTLHVQGTPAEPILFTSDRATPGPGQWTGLIFNPSSTNNLLDYVTVEYAGYFAPAIEIHTSSVTIQNSIIARNAHDGIEVADGTPTVTQSNIFDNGEYGLRRTGDDTPVQASCNWWGNASGPTVETNPDGIGQKVSSGVIYEKWLVAPAPDGPCTGFVPRVYMPYVSK